jgi:hypothetical protein
MHLFKRFIAMPYLGPEDGAMSGGADDAPFSGGAQDFESAGEGADDAMAQDGGGDDPAGEQGRDEDVADLLAGDDDDDDTQSLSHEDRLRKVAKTNRRLKRQLAKLLPFRDLQKQGIDVSAVLQNARQFQAFQQRVQSDPRLRKAMLAAMAGDDDGGGESQSGGGRQAPTRFGRPAISDFDPAKAPWDTESESGKHFVGEAQLIRSIGKYVASLEDTFEARLRQLEGGIQSRDQREQHQQRQSYQKEWLSAADAAAKKITNPGVRTLFSDAMKLAMTNPEARQIGVQRVAAHYLKQLGVNPTQARIAAAAAQGRTAHNNGRLPRNMAGGNGTPTPARGKAERVSDVHKRLRQLPG